MTMIRLNTETLANALMDPKSRCVIAVGPEKEMLRGFFDVASGMGLHLVKIDSIVGLPHEPVLLLADAKVLSNDAIRAMQKTIGLPPLSDQAIGAKTTWAFGPRDIVEETIAALMRRLRLQTLEHIRADRS